MASAVRGMLCHLFPYSPSPGCGKWTWAVGRLCSSRRVASSTPWDTSVLTTGLHWSKVSLHHVLEGNQGHYRAKDGPLTVLPVVELCCTAHSSSPGHHLAGEGIDSKLELHRAPQEHFAISGLQLPLLITGLGLLLVEGKEDSLWADGILSAKRMLLMLLNEVGWGFPSWHLKICILALSQHRLQPGLCPEPKQWQQAALLWLCTDIHHQNWGWECTLLEMGSWGRREHPSERFLGISGPAAELGAAATLSAPALG